MSFQERIVSVFILVFLIISVTSSSSARLFPSNSEPSIPSVQQKEITIRNVTKEKLFYTIKVCNSPNPPTRRTLDVNEVHRYPGDEALDVSFWRDQEKIDYRLDPGESYSFRYDENNKIDIFAGSHGRTDVVDLAPYVRTPMDVVERMLEMAEVDKNDILVDLGCGDGRIVITAAKKYGIRGIGIDLEPQRIKESIANAKAAGVEELVEFRLEDATLSDFSQASVVTMYLLTESNELLRPHLERQLRFGTLVVSHNYPIERWESKLVDYVSFTAVDGKEHSIWVYRR